MYLVDLFEKAITCFHFETAEFGISLKNPYLRIFLTEHMLPTYVSHNKI
jgi:hypothetical protein